MPAKAQRIHKGLLSNGGGISYLIMYHGGVMPGRGIERLIEAVSRLNGVGLVILGNGSVNYLSSLKEMTKENEVDDKVLFHSAVSISKLWQYVGAVDVSMAPIELVVKNHYYSLPNKFFESIQSLTPIIASKVPEMERIIEQYQIGLTCKPGDVEDICRCIEKMRTDKKFYTRCKKNLGLAKQELCWENEKKILEKAYTRLV